MTEFEAEEIRRRIQFYMKPDPFGLKGPRFGYMCASLYFDSPDLVLFNNTVYGLKNRFKIRARYYDDVKSPLFLEEKRRTNDVITKSRVKISRDGLTRLSAGEMLSPDMIIDKSPMGQAEGRRLMDLWQQMQLKPAMFVRYWREPFLCTEHHDLRITIDRGLEGHEVHGRQAFQDSPSWFPAGDHREILELKFQGSVPSWVHQMISCFGMRREPYPKYLNCQFASMWNNRETYRAGVAGWTLPDNFRVERQKIEYIWKPELCERLAHGPAPAKDIPAVAPVAPVVAVPSTAPAAATSDMLSTGT